MPSFSLPLHPVETIVPSLVAPATGACDAASAPGVTSSPWTQPGLPIRGSVRTWSGQHAATPAVYRVRPCSLPWCSPGNGTSCHDIRPSPPASAVAE